MRVYHPTLPLHVVVSISLESKHYFGLFE